MTSRAGDGTNPEPVPSLGSSDRDDQDGAEAQPTPEDLERSQRRARAIGQVAVRELVSRP